VVAVAVAVAVMGLQTGDDFSAALAGRGEGLTASSMLKCRWPPMNLVIQSGIVALPRLDLPLRIRPATPVSDEDLWELSRANRDLRIERTAEGEIIVMPPTGGKTGRRNAALVVAIGAWAREDGTGLVFDSSTGFRLANGAERSPDVAWVRRARWDALTEVQQEGFPPLCPDFVVELRSRSDDLDDLHSKMREYIENGATLGWLLDPASQTVWVYERGIEPISLVQASTLSGEPTLRGLAVELAVIW
jgi:Uma2 family endonuclease